MISATNPLLRSCLDIEYQYVVMYSFAPASQALQTVSSQAAGDVLSSQNASALSRLASLAKQACYDLLSVVVHTLGPSRLLTYVPVRFWLFVVAASLHLLKVAQDPNLLSCGTNTAFSRKR